MARPDPALLHPARYPFACEITTRFADMDLNRHLNNVALAGLIEESRVRFNSGIDLARVLVGRGAMIASIAIEYLSQAFYPEPVRGHSAVERVGNSSWATVQLLVQDQRVIAFARSTLVCVAEGASAALPVQARAALERMVLR